MPYKVVLAEDEILAGIEIAVGRLFFAIENSLGDSTNRGRKTRSWDVDIEGALGEIAVAKFLRRTMNDIKGEADIGTNIQIRTTKYKKGHLLIQEKDPDDHQFVLVRGGFGTYEIVGWILGKNGKKKEWWNDRFQCYAIPGKHLIDIKEIKV